MMGATLLQTPELAISPDEAQVLNAAIQQVNEQYDVSFISPKIAAWIHLTIAAGSVYGPRAIAIVARKKAAEKAERDKRTAEVVPMAPFDLSQKNLN